MPYNSASELPESVKDNLPTHAQEIYLKAFNNAWEEYKNPEDRQGNSDHEETAHKVAWAAVKNVYKKNDETGKWIEK